jgi:hypothetical protein
MLRELTRLNTQLDAALNEFARGDQVAKLIGRKTALPEFPRGKWSAKKLAREAADLRLMKKGKMRFGDRVLQPNEVVPSQLAYSKDSTAKTINDQIRGQAMWGYKPERKTKGYISGK